MKRAIREKNKKNKFYLQKLKEIFGKSTTECYKCQRVIIASDQPNGKITYEKGQPICTVCQIMKNKEMANKIKSDKKNFRRDRRELAKLRRQHEKDSLMEAIYKNQAKNKDIRIKK